MATDLVSGNAEKSALPTVAVANPTSAPVTASAHANSTESVRGCEALRRIPPTGGAIVKTALRFQGAAHDDTPAVAARNISTGSFALAKPAKARAVQAAASATAVTVTRADKRWPSFTAVFCALSMPLRV